ncbi:MAG: hypothetical protein JXA99_03575 [Candidatus Lokiarchaeota archaeon]|nr:hypothetical protein [Candidatus Lokiarchaeota archaeon]
MSSENSASDKFKRITISIDVVNERLVQSLEGIKGTSKSKVINNIIEEWIEQNADKIMSMWEIDLIGLRKIAQTTYKGITIDNDLQVLEKDLFNQMVEMFKGISSIDINDAAEFLKVHVESIKKIVFFHNPKLKNAGVELIYQDGKLINKKLI